MKVVHIESGLGNQMLSYAELLLLKKLNPDDVFYVETLIFDIPECNDVICQWNGYELERIFGIREKNVCELFSEKDWEDIRQTIRKSRFWEDWNYPQIFVDAFAQKGLKLKNFRGTVNCHPAESLKSKLTNNYLGYTVKRFLRPLYEKQYVEKMSVRDKMFIKTDDDIFTGQWLGLMNKNSGIEYVEREIRAAYQFPELKNEKDKELLRLIENCNSVSIHARRGDALGTNGYCYKYGYFKRAVKHIRSRVKDPVFIFFTDPGSIDWCRENEDVFGLNFKKDTVLFADWNKGNESYRDMQLMSKCKHNIITFSSFGWWGAWLNENPEKITCSPSVWIDTTMHF